MQPVATAFALASLTAFVLAQVQPPPRPVVRSAPVQELVADLADESRASGAQEELLRIGKQAVTELMRVVVDEGRASASKQSKRALVVLGRMGPTAAHAVDGLVEAHASCGSDIYLALLHAIADLVPYGEYQRDPRFIERVAQGNRRMYERFSRGNDRQRFQYEFNRLRKRTMVDPGSGLESMIDEVKLNRTHRREVAAEVLGRMGKAARKAVPALARALSKRAPVMGQIGGFSVPRYRDEFARAGSAALIKIAPHDPRTAIAWGWHLAHATSERVRMRAALRIGTFGERAKGQVPNLITALRDESLRVRHEVITALGMVGPPARAALPALRKLAKDADRGTADRARSALALIEAKKD